MQKLTEDKLLSRKTPAARSTLQLDSEGETMDEITQHIDMMSHKQVCLDLEKATQFITQALQHEVGRNQELCVLIRRLEEMELETGRSLTEQAESNRQLKLKNDELQKHLEEKDHSLSQANQTVAFLKNERRDLHQQLRRQQSNHRTIQDVNESLQDGESQFKDEQMESYSSPLQSDQMTAQESLVWSEPLGSAQESLVWSEPLVSSDAQSPLVLSSHHSPAVSSSAESPPVSSHTLVSADAQRPLEAPVSAIKYEYEYVDDGYEYNQPDRADPGTEQTPSPAEDIQTELMQICKMAAFMAPLSSTDDEEENTPVSHCYMHITSVKHEEVNYFTATRWNTYRTSLQKWLRLEGESRDVSENFKHCVDVEFDNIPEDAGFHHTCYRRYTDKKAIAKVETRLARERQEATEDHEAIPSTSSGTGPTKKLRSRSGLPIAGSGPVVPALCVICQKEEKFISRAGKRQRDTLSKAETLTAGQLLKAAELKEDQSILMHIKDKDCVALEVQYHKGCYNQYTRFLTRPEKPEKEQNEPTFDVSYKIFCERIIRQRLLVNQEVLRMGQLRKAFIELVKANEGLDASNYRQDMLKKRLTRDFPQLVFHIPTRRNICELVYLETLSTRDVPSGEAGEAGEAEPHLSS